MINANIALLPVINHWNPKKPEQFSLNLAAIRVVLLSYAQKDKANARSINDLDSLLANQSGNGCFIEKLTGNSKAVFDELAPLTAEQMLARANALLENLDWAADLVAAKAQRQAELDAINAAAAAEAGFMGLPALTGSEKQVAWANTLRAEVLKLATPEQQRAIEKGKWKAVATKAKYWIDRRFEDKAATLAEALKK